MKIISLGNNCFWGLLSKSVHLQQHTLDFFTKTSFLSEGIISTNGNSATTVDSLHNFLQNCDADNYLWLNYNNISYRSNKDSSNRDWINYYWYENKTMPLFFRHINGVYIDNPKFFEIIRYQMQYKENPGDIYILAIEDDNINAMTTYMLNSIVDILHKWNQSSELVVFSQSRLDSSKFKNVVIPLGHCRWKENEDYAVDEQTFNSICTAIDFQLNRAFFLDIDKKPLHHRS